MRRYVTSALEAFLIVAFVVGAASVVVGVALLSVPVAFIVGGVELFGLGLGALWVSGRVGA